MIAALHGWLLKLKPWQRLVVGFGVGAASTLAMPPWHILPLLLISFPLLLWMLEGCRTWKEAAALGWSFGFGHFAVGLNWIANAFYVDAETHGVFAIPAVGALCAGFGLYVAIVTAIVHRIPHDPEGLPYDRTPTAVHRAVAFGLLWASVEWVRGWFLSGFPWNPIGSVWTAWPAMIQIASVVGTLGLSVATVLAAALPSILGAGPRMRQAWLIAAVPFLVLGLFGVFGVVRLTNATASTVPDVTLRLVQPNIAQADKWRPGLRDQHFMDHVRLSSGPGIENVTHVIWGEAAVAFALDRDEARRQLAVSMLQPGGALLTGVPRAAAGPNGLDEIFNSLLVIDAFGAVRASYDKTHLVPFGEYLPLRWLIPFPKLTEGTMDFSAGPGRTTLRVDGLPAFSPLICYEAIFSGAVTGPDAAGERPRWMLNITNDSWFGDTSGPRQHLAAAQLRAVEEGLPLVRVANTGVSAVIDPFGRVEQQLGLNQRGTIDSQLPQALDGKTIFGVTGQGLPLALIVLGFAGLGWHWRQQKKDVESEV
jgi:apolipoprotein N-acyltransferase